VDRDRSGRKDEAVTTLYRADQHGLTHVEGLRSWTSSRAHADEYASGDLAGFGGPCVYSATVAATDAVLDLRADPAAALAESVGLDLDDYEHAHLRDLCRDLAPAFRAFGFAWVAFRDRQDRPAQDYDEWLYLGVTPLPARASGQ
jgi:hypothetical protein